MGKIGDYGASTVYRLPWESTIHMSTGLCGSEPYIAPEQFLGKRKQTSLLHPPCLPNTRAIAYDARLVDIWACGIVYYCLHFQELPWRVAQPTDPLFATYVAATESKRQAEAACNGRPDTILRKADANELIPMRIVHPVCIPCSSWNLYVLIHPRKWDVVGIRARGHLTRPTPQLRRSAASPC